MSHKRRIPAVMREHSRRYMEEPPTLGLVQTIPMSTIYYIQSSQLECSHSAGGGRVGCQYCWKLEQRRVEPERWF